MKRAASIRAREIGEYRMATIVEESLNLLLDDGGLADAALAEQYQAWHVDEPIECDDIVDVSAVLGLRIHEEAVVGQRVRSIAHAPEAAPGMDDRCVPGCVPW